MKKTRIKKSCARCKHWEGFPYVHCVLECKIINYYVDKEKKVFETKPVNQQECKQKRWLHNFIELLENNKL